MPERVRYSEAEAAAVLGTTARTLRRWRKDGHVAHQCWPGGRITYTADDLASFAARCHRMAAFGHTLPAK